MAYIVDLDTLSTTAELAAELGVSPRRIRQLAASKALGYRLANTILFTPAEVELLRGRRTDRTPKRFRKGKNLIFGHSDT